MADTTKIIDPDNGAGTDYTSLNAWEAWADGEGSSGDTHTAQCRSSSGTADTTAFTKAGWTTGVICKIEAVSGHQALKTGWSDSRYRLSLTGANITISQDNVKIYDIQIAAGTGYGDACITVDNFGTQFANVIIDCVRLKGGSGNQQYGCLIGRISSGSIVQILNSIITGFSTTSSYGIRVNSWADDAGTVRIYNDVIYGCATGVSEAYGAADVKNSAVFNNTDDFSVTGASSISYCASDDGDGSNAVAPSGSNWSNEFSNPSGDFTLLNTGNLYNAGIGPGSDSNIPATDIDGDTRSGSTCDIGADEYVSSGTTKTVTDTGSGSDSISQVLNSISVSDTGSGTDAFSGQAALSVADTGAGTDSAPEISVSIQVADNGAASDIISQILASLSIQDTASAADTIAQVLAGIIITDSGSGVEIVSTDSGLIIKTVADEGSGTDAVVSPIVTLSITDTATASDIIGQIIAALNVTESGLADDAISILKTKLVELSDSGSGSDAVLPVSVSLTVSDVGAVSEIIGQVLASLSVMDTGAGSDIIVVIDAAQVIRGRVRVMFTTKRTGVVNTTRETGIVNATRKTSITIN